VAAAYAHNASYLSGLHESQFLRADQHDTAVGNIFLAGTPLGSAVFQGLLYVGPGSANADDTLLGIAGGGQQRFRVDAEGDTDVAGNLTVDGNAGGGYGVLSHGVEAGGRFEDSDGSGIAIVGVGDLGISAGGTLKGGYFTDSDQTGAANIAVGDIGVEAYGGDLGGEFDGGNGGIDASGALWGGHFSDSNGSGVAYVGYGNRGIEANGAAEGGYFQDLDDSAHAYIAKGHRGIEAYGYEMGGFFQDSNHSGYAHIGVGNVGVKGYGDGIGGYFENTSNGHYLRAGDADSGNHGITVGAHNGGLLQSTGGTWVGLAYFGGWSTIGNGGKNFVQNHPHDKNKVIRYTSLEGDEVGTYTRGSGRLVDGLARISLGETFQWVTNPDIGLTALLTPRGRAEVLFVESLSSTELVVRGPAGSDAAFDYIVHGLRIGFEEQSVVTDKQIESLIPAMDADRDLFERDPQLREYTALVRFEKMATETGRSTADRSRSKALESSIGRYDPEVHGPVKNLLGFGSPIDDSTVSSSIADEAGEDDTTPPVSVVVEAGGVLVADPMREGDPCLAGGDSPAADAPPATILLVSETVEAGDVLAFDPDSVGLLRVAASMSDPAVVGVATAPSAGEGDGEGALHEVPVALTGLVDCKVDAGYGAIRTGDLLTSSPTVGHGMRALEALPGTILGKAAEPLDAGTGTIKVLVMPR
jgi:hypothetical protein